MKKVLAIFLALVIIMSVALVACGKKDSKTNSGDDNDDEFVAQVKGDDTSDTDTDTDDTQKPAADVFVELSASRTIWAMTGVNLRSAPSMGKNVDKIGVVAGTELVATSKSENWYKITYNNETRYVSVAYVTENKADSQFTIFENESDCFELTIKPSGNTTPNQINLRTKPVFDETLKFTTLKESDVTAEKKLVVVGMNATGTWYIVSYNNEETPYFLAITSQTRPYLNGLPTQGGDFGG